MNIEIINQQRVYCLVMPVKRFVEGDAGIFSSAINFRLDFWWMDYTFTLKIVFSLSVVIVKMMVTVWVV